MGAPFLTRYGAQYNEPEKIDEVIQWIVVTEEKTRDPKTGLLYHAWDESKEQRWADKRTGRSPHVWGRGMGWYAMALVDVLDVVEESPARQKLLETLQRTADAILSVQDQKTGLWYQVLDKPKGKGNYLEGSASAMFSYFLLKSINEGYLDEYYLESAKKGYNGIIEHLIQQKEDGRIVLTQICSGAGLGGSPYRDGSYEYYISEGRKDNDAKGVGPFIMASLQFEAL